MITANKENFEEIINSKTPVLVDFNAEWCGPCRMMKPILEELANDTKIVSVNVDELEEIAQKYNVSSIPCLILFKEKKELRRSIGLKPVEEIKEFIGEE